MGYQGISEVVLNLARRTDSEGSDQRGLDAYIQFATQDGYNPEPLPIVAIAEGGRHALNEKAGQCGVPNGGDGENGKIGVGSAPGGAGGKCPLIGSSGCTFTVGSNTMTIPYGTGDGGDGATAPMSGSPGGPYAGAKGKNGRIVVLFYTE